jgi:peptidyl-prolyl cis-trans isomerase A (cyclophilin A)
MLMRLALAVCVSTGAAAAQDVVAVTCQTTRGPLRIAVNRKFAPLGVERFLDLVDDGFFTEHPLYRAIDNFLVQFGLAGDPDHTREWTRKGPLPDDPDLGLRFAPGVLSYAGGGPNTRDTSLFFATSRDPGQLEWFGTQLWERPLGIVTEGLDTLMSFHTGYGDMAEQGGRGPSQSALQETGAATLERFPKLDYLNTCTRAVPTAKDRQAVRLADWPRTAPLPPLQPEPQDDPTKEIDVWLLNHSGRTLELFWDDGGAGIFLGDAIHGGKVQQTTYPDHSFQWRMPGTGKLVCIERMTVRKSKYICEDGREL